MLQNSIENGCKNLYFYRKPFKFNFKSNLFSYFKLCSYLKSLFPIVAHKPVNPNFWRINLAETIANLLFLGNSIRNDCKNLYLHPKSFKTIITLNPHLMPISCRISVNPSTPTFPNINLARAIRNLLFIGKITEKLLQKSAYPPLYH